MDWDGANVEKIGYLNNAQALHPFQLTDGRLRAVRHALSRSCPADGLAVDLVAGQAVLTVKIQDNAGHVTAVTRAFAAASPSP
jgi:hypothetical protein